MAEEENEAIEDLKDILKYWQTIVDIEDDVEREIEMNCYFEEMPFKQLKIALNLIEKLQKENEEYKLLNANIEKANKIIEGKEEYIPKDKIREKLERLESQKENYKEQPLIYMLLKNQYKELLEEVKK